MGFMEKANHKSSFSVSIISDREAEFFLETTLHHGYNLIMIESCEHKRLPNEQRYIVDAALCEIC